MFLWKITPDCPPLPCSTELFDGGPKEGPKQGIPRLFAAARIKASVSLCPHSLVSPSALNLQGAHENTGERATFQIMYESHKNTSRLKLIKSYTVGQYRFYNCRTISCKEYSSKLSKLAALGMD